MATTLVAVTGGVASGKSEATRAFEALGVAARARTVDRFAWNRVFEDLCTVYGDVSGEGAFNSAE